MEANIKNGVLHLLSNLKAHIILMFKVSLVQFKVKKAHSIKKNLIDHFSESDLEEVSTISPKFNNMKITGDDEHFNTGNF